MLDKTNVETQLVDGVNEEIYKGLHCSWKEAKTKENKSVIRISDAPLNLLREREIFSVRSPNAVSMTLVKA